MDLTKLINKNNFYLFKEFFLNLNEILKIEKDDKFILNFLKKEYINIEENFETYCFNKNNQYKEDLNLLLEKTLEIFIYFNEKYINLENLKLKKYSQYRYIILIENLFESNLYKYLEQTNINFQNFQKYIFYNDIIFLLSRVFEFYKEDEDFKNTDYKYWELIFIILKKDNFTYDDYTFMNIEIIQNLKTILNIKRDKFLRNNENYDFFSDIVINLFAQMILNQNNEKKEIKFETPSIFSDFSMKIFEISLENKEYNQEKYNFFQKSIAEIINKAINENENLDNKIIKKCVKNIKYEIKYLFKPKFSKLKFFLSFLINLI